MSGLRYLTKQGTREPRPVYRFRDTDLFLTLMLWMCTLPLVAIVGLRFLGWEITLYLAVFLLVADLVACWFLCKFRTPKNPENQKYWGR